MVECSTNGGAGRGRRSVAAPIIGALVVAGILAWALAGRRDEFAEALRTAPLWVLLVAAVLQVLALVSRGAARGLVHARWRASGRRAIRALVDLSGWDAELVLGDARSGHRAGGGRSRDARAQAAASL